MSPVFLLIIFDNQHWQKYWNCHQRWENGLSYFHEKEDDDAEDEEDSKSWDFSWVDEDGDEDGEEDEEEDVEEDVEEGRIEGEVEFPDPAVVKGSVWRVV